MISRVTILIVVKMLLLMFNGETSQARTLQSDNNAGPEIGKPLPDFRLVNITHFKKKIASNVDFKGKWLFMDFWYTGCAACIKSFPKVSEFQKEFKDEALFLMVGLNDQKYNKGIEKLYESLRKKQGLVMASAYDSILVDRWKINSMPYIVIVDPEGLVRSVTGGRDITKQKIRDLINGKKVSFFPHSSNRERLDFDVFNSYGTREKLIYQSIVTQWNGEYQYIPSRISYWIRKVKKTGEFKIAMAPLHWLYNYAYLGECLYDLLPSDSLYAKVYPFPIIETKDSSLFEYDYRMDIGKGTYNYSLVIPPTKATVEYVMNKMQDDLECAFGFKVSLETREVPVWNLIAKPNAEKKLRTKGGEPYWSSTDSSGGAAGFTMKNYTVDEFLNTVMNYIGPGQPPYFNETGFTENIDITMNADMTNRKAIKIELQKHGLDLEKGKRKMLTVVITDMLTN